MKKILTLFLITFTSVFINAQNAEEVLNKLNVVYSENSPLQFETKYNLYKNKSSKQIYETYNGVFKKNEKNEIYQKIDKTEFIWNKKMCLSIFHPDELMMLSFSQPISTEQFDLKKLLEICSIKSFINKGKFWELIIENKPFSGLEYSKIVIQINKNYFIQKQLFYYNTSINFSKDFNKQDLDLPVLEIVYSNFNRNKIENSFFDFSKYIVESKNGIQPSKAYSNYVLEDQREITLK
ncbi:hypothetical protein FIA58_020080 [Flavobacterium jejuense]|uniref:Outer membrane lipoprotein-sorting protein n=1 Tax=Flavobacterium jejuense TaxID=1544455 RepID=A0ABX0J1Y3_9FLAO|nr:hypothetical protein [Flavobacterium jejuense]NHN27984.1 hypothetical protein [Flavobacterium jejuense]